MLLLQIVEPVSIDGLAPILQLAAAIYFSLCVEGLSDKLYKSGENGQQIIDGIMTDIRLSGFKGRGMRLLKRNFSLIKEYDPKITKYSANFGFFASVLCLLLIGIHSLCPCLTSIYNFLSRYWVGLCLITLIIPTVLCLYLSNRPYRVASKIVKPEYENINKWRATSYIQMFTEKYYGTYERIYFNDLINAQILRISKKFTFVSYYSKLKLRQIRKSRSRRVL